MSVELKPCPFCGADAAIRNWQDEELWSHAIVEWQKVHCTECECEGISSCPGYEPDTVQAWNTRAPQWLPIDSAPTDGRTQVLLWSHGEVLIGLRPVGCPDDAAADLMGTACYPTHWQPLPAPPEVQP